MTEASTPLSTTSILPYENGQANSRSYALEQQRRVSFNDLGEYVTELSLKFECSKLTTKKKEK